MKELMSYIPKKYRPHVVDFHKEFEEGWTYWLSLDCNGEYYLEGYAAEYTIHENTLTETLQAFKRHIRKKIEIE